MKFAPSQFLPLPLATGAASLFLSACGIQPPVTPAPTGHAMGTPPVAAASPSVPAGFLQTEYAPLQRWLDERFEVEYRNQTPELVFDQSPISDIRYATTDLPKGAPLFHLKSSDLSRREILHRIAAFWDLHMTVEAENGTPSYVRVVGPGGATDPAATGPELVE
jgi:hypothetical protein